MAKWLPWATQKYKQVFFLINLMSSQVPFPAQSEGPMSVFLQQGFDRLTWPLAAFLFALPCHLLMVPWMWVGEGGTFLLVSLCFRILSLREWGPMGLWWSLTSLPWPLLGCLLREPAVGSHLCLLWAPVLWSYHKWDLSAMKMINLVWFSAGYHGTYASVISVLRRMMQEDSHEFGVSLGYMQIKILLKTGYFCVNEDSGLGGLTRPSSQNHLEGFLFLRTPWLLPIFRRGLLRGRP